MNIRNILALGLLVLAIVLSVVTWKSESTPASKAPPAIQSSVSSPGNEMALAPLATNNPKKTGESLDIVSRILMHKKTFGIIIVTILALLGIFLTRGFFNRI